MIAGSDRRSGGTDPILSTQRIPRGRDLIFSTQRIPRWGDHRVAMRQKMAIFKGGNSVCKGTNVFTNGETIGGDASENGDFQRRKQRLQGPFFSGALILYSERENQGDDATENDNFEKKKQRLQGRKNLNFIFYFKLLNLNILKI